MFRVLLVLAALTVVPSALAAAEGGNPFGLEESADADVRLALEDLYRLRFNDALARFEKLKPLQKKHPMIAFGAASVHWWRLSVNVDERDEEKCRPFLAAAEEALSCARDAIKRGDETGEAHLTLGSTLGLLGRWHAANRHWWTAYRQGKNARQALERARDINPQLADAWLGLGLYDYYVATLPAVLRVLGFLGKGDPAIGLAELERAANEGYYTAVAARLFLIGIDAGPGQAPAKAAEALTPLRARFPESPFLHMLSVTANYNAGNQDAVEKEAELFRQKIEKGVYPATARAQGFFLGGLAHFKARRWAEAARLFDAGREAGDEETPFPAWCALYSGYAHDALGKRDQAKERYSDVLKLRPRWRSREHAEAALAHPFEDGHATLETLTL